MGTETWVACIFHKGAEADLVGNYIITKLILSKVEINMTHERIVWFSVTKLVSCPMTRYRDIVHVSLKQSGLFQKSFLFKVASGLQRANERRRARVHVCVSKEPYNKGSFRKRYIYTLFNVGMRRVHLETHQNHAGTPHLKHLPDHYSLEFFAFVSLVNSQLSERDYCTASDTDTHRHMYIHI